MFPRKKGGGVPRLQGESKPSLRWSLPSGSLRKSKKVNSLIYKDYTLMEHEDGTKSYVSPARQAELLAEEKIRRSEAKIKVENEEFQRKSREPGRGGGAESDSDSAYETPISPAESNFSFAKPKSCGDLDKMLTVPATPPQRNSSFSCFEENFGGANSEKINLPPFIKPLETSLTLPIAKKRSKEKKKNRDSGESIDNKIEIEKNCDISFPKEEVGKLGSVPQLNSGNGSDEVDKRKIFFSRRSIPVRDKDKKKSKNYGILPETEPRESLTRKNSLKNSKKRFSLPWRLGSVRDEEKLYSFEEEKEKSLDAVAENTNYFSGDEKIDAPKYRNQPSFKPLSLSRTKSKKFQADVAKDDHPKSTEVVRVNEAENHSKLLPESKSNLLDLIDETMARDLKEPEEVFLEEEEPKIENKYGVKEFIPSVMSYKKNFENENCETTKTNSSQQSPKRHTFGFSLPRYSDNLAEPKPRKLRNRQKIDPNPLRKMFGIRNVQKGNVEPERNSKNLNTLEKPNYQETKFDRPDTEVQNIGSLNVSDSGQSSKTYLTEGENLQCTNRPSEVRVNVETDIDSHKLTFQNGDLCLTGEKQFDLDDIPTNRRTYRSDTESADHGSAYKSSMSKLTTQKQPKKLMSGFFGSFKLVKPKDRVIDADLNISPPPSVEITVKEPDEDVHMNGTPKADGIVYAELDMARPGGNLMRRDEGEKTEYAEIIYPSSKLTAERAVDELRKSRENLVSSRENLAEMEEEAFTTTTITADGKKEAAV